MVLCATPAQQTDLLRVAELDGLRARLAHTARTLPERAALAELSERAAALEQQAAAAHAATDDLEARTRTTQREVDETTARIARDDARLTSGALGTAREVEAVQGGLATLRQRLSDLEDTQLEQMEEAEEAEADGARLAEQSEQVAAATAEATASRDALLSDLRGQDTAAGAERERLAAGLPPAVLDAYARAGAAAGGVGAAALQGSRCTGCHLDLAGTALAEVRGAPADVLPACEECGRLLVRVGQAGT